MANCKWLIKAALYIYIRTLLDYFYKGIIKSNLTFLHCWCFSRSAPSLTSGSPWGPFCSPRTKRHCWPCPWVWHWHLQSISTITLEILSIHTMLCSTLPPPGGCLSRGLIAESKKRPDKRRTKIVPKIPSEDTPWAGISKARVLSLWPSEAVAGRRDPVSNRYSPAMESCPDKHDPSRACRSCSLLWVTLNHPPACSSGPEKQLIHQYLPLPSAVFHWLTEGLCKVGNVLDQGLSPHIGLYNLPTAGTRLKRPFGLCLTE